MMTGIILTLAAIQQKEGKMNKIMYFVIYQNVNNVWEMFGGLEEEKEIIEERYKEARKLSSNCKVCSTIHD